MSTSSKTVVIDTAGAGSANRLAGLQIDLSQKFRAGQLSMDHIKWFLDLTKEERNRLLLKSLPVSGSFKNVEQVIFNLVELDPSLLGLPKEPNSPSNVIKLAEAILGLEPCALFASQLAQHQCRDQFFGIGFVNRKTEFCTRIYFFSRLYLASVDLSGQE